jgi:hypothetical protein
VRRTANSPQQGPPSGTQAIPAYRPGPGFAREQAARTPGPSAEFIQRSQNAAQSGRPVLSGAESVSDDRSTWPHALADGMAVGSLILSLLGFGVIGIVLGAIHASNAHKLRQRSSAVGAWGIGIGIAGTVAWALIIIMLIVAGVAASHSASTGYYG